MAASLSIKRDWFSDPKANILAGITVAFALIPEAIAFSIVAGVNPMVGLYASFTIAVMISFFGGRPAMISAATGAMALLMVGLVKAHGVEYLFAATILTGIIQVIVGYLKLGRFISFVPHSVMTGFVNALAILIFMSQLTHFVGQGWIMYSLVALTLLIIYILPRFTRAVPSALVAIIVVSAITISLKISVPTVGDMGNIISAFPVFHLPDFIPTLDNLMIILPYSISLALVGLLESLLTATILDDMTDTSSDKNREVKGQGLANVVTGFFGGMAGCAMIGQSVINVKSGGRTRLSTFVAGTFLLFLILVLSSVVKEIPMAALVGVMIMVSIGTFDWSSLVQLKKIPIGDALVMIVTVSIVVITHDLSYGVMAGVLLSALIFVSRISNLRVSSRLEKNGLDKVGKKVYSVSGQLFFGTTTHFGEKFEYIDDPNYIVIDFSHSHVWDHSAVNAIAKTVTKYRQLDKHVEVVGLNEESKRIIDKIGIESSGGH
ncbi:SulP family inorganic anion transporter [Cohnella luojiensis]|uniref:SulP family inorganic anion transporter n=1 Tax=Cohnella luojiensis TaxID=652876 RepID=A0A4Y8LQL1_9BACL|nr:SulP family inorganic anion transporter [Cohnella luojiensis]TFE19352.1 SulP family inorganic anion transporter [Cohnella luojiensis]